MISKLTSEQEAKIEIYRKKWSDAFFKSEFNEKKCFEFIDWMYSLIKKPMPIKIVLNSPFLVQLACNILGQKLRSQLDSQLSSQLDSQLDSQLKFFNFDYNGDTSWFGYLCFYDFVNSELFPQIKIDIFEKYKEYSKCKLLMWISFEGIAIISKPPVFNNFDNFSYELDISRIVIETKTFESTEYLLLKISSFSDQSSCESLSKVLVSIF